MRGVPEWVGRTADSPVPPRVRVRVFDHDNGRCQCGCGREILIGDKWQTDHTVAIVNGGENRERNLRTVLTEHHKTKTAVDVAEKAKVYAVRMKHLGFHPVSKNPMPGGKKTKWKKTFHHGTVRR